MPYDYLIVGAGFSGSVCARQLADAGKRVLIIDKRDHIGGNAYDYVNEHGVRIHKYGPHIFHTNADYVFEYLSRFTEWRPYEHRVLASVAGKLVPFPINLDTLRLLYGLDLDESGMRAWIAEEVAQSWEEGRPVLTAEDQCLSTVGRRLYETFFKGYTTKMWGVTPDKLDRSVTARIPLRFNHDDRYFTDKHQAMPKHGYTALFERMLDHPFIHTRLGMPMPGLRFDMQRPDPLDSVAGRLPGVVMAFGERCEHIIWTAPIDNYFNEALGPLPYRSLSFLMSRHARNGPAVTINLPSAEDVSTRLTDMGLLTDTKTHKGGTCVIGEMPTAEGEPYYPVPSPEGRALYRQYEALADKEPNVTFLGRLGSYQYLNMDQAVGQALAVSKRLLGEQPRH